MNRWDKESLKEALSLYLVTDDKYLEGKDILQVLNSAVEGGVTAIQFRLKKKNDRELLALAKDLRTLTTEKGLLFIIDDRLDLALAAEADGVHLGKEDIPLEEAQKIGGKELIIGVTVENAKEAKEAALAGADYLGTAAVFPTPTKSYNEPPLGKDELQKITAAVDIPVVAIGGINRENAFDILQTGVAGIAVISAILNANDPKKAAQELKNIIEKAKGRN